MVAVSYIFFAKRDARHPLSDVSETARIKKKEHSLNHILKGDDGLITDMYSLFISQAIKCSK